MKKTLPLGLLCLALCFIFVGCQKEELTSTDTVDNSTIAQQTFSKTIAVKNGALVFENDAHLKHWTQELAAMTPQERIEFEDGLGFRSLSSIYHEVNQAEIQAQEVFFRGVNPDLEVAEYEEMGLFYENTPLYRSYLAKGTISEFTHSDRSKSFVLTVDQPHLEQVLNEAGDVVIGEQLISYRGDGTWVYNAETGELIREVESGKTSLNGEFDFRMHARRPGAESQSGNVWWIKDPAKGSNYRYYAFAHFNSSYTTSLLAQTYYWAARAEKKSWGNWNTNNNYNPIWGISAQWSYDYWINHPKLMFPVKRDGSQYPLPNNSNRPESPYSLSNLNTNYTVRYMYPHGNFTISSPYTFWENVRIYNQSYTFKFSGGSSGYNYVAQ